MLNIFIRTLILYTIIIVLMRLTGKRQIGQLELTELVTAFMISELASSPITNNTIPLLYGVIPAVTLVCLEVFLSYISLKSRTFRKLVAGNALALIDNGKIDKEKMNKARITVEELISAMRLSGICCVSEVKYAFLEPSGNISFLTKACKAPPCAEDIKIKVKEQGMEHSVIIDGNINYEELKSINKNEEWLTKQMAKNGFKSKNDIFYMGVNDLDEIYIIGKEKK